MLTEVAIGATLAFIVGVIIGYFIDRIRRGSAYQSYAQILKQAELDSENLLKSQKLEAKEELLKRREALEEEVNKQREELWAVEKKLSKRENALEDQQADFLKKEAMIQTTQSKLAARSKAVEAREQELERSLKKQQEELFKISGLDRETASQMLLDRLDNDLKNETGALIMKHQNELKQTCDKIARETIGMAVQRFASGHVAETTVSTVELPEEEMKGRIIGREGRNIRAFEKATGVDVIVDDTPGVVVVSAFDNVRRQIGKMSLQKLVNDGRIHPARIEEVVEETQKELEEYIQTMGQNACQEVNISGVNPKLIDLLGRLHFRTSYSQNVLRHSIEVSALTGMMAEQLGLDGTIARRCGLFHDIGKAADHEMEGGHPAVGAQLLKRYGESQEVVHAAAGHHDDIRPDYIYTVLVAAADACSASRPGARRDTLEKYVRRLEELETLVCGFPGVDHTYAIQAGREVRVIVDSDQVNDREAAKMCKDIAKAIEDTLTYPGEIRVTVMREARTVEYAR
ncbi:MAG: ribonuclease Y [Planctomycetaceae bacterium]|nr:ribonuclease Y [Planctomycetaceae bacterium]